jgi:DNA processing protein
MTQRSSPSPDGACAACARRCWLLSQLGGSLDWCARDPRRLSEALALDDAGLLEALGGRRRAKLRSDYDSWESHAPAPPSAVEQLCRHDPRYPQALRGAATPRMLQLSGGASRLQALCAAPLVAIVGSRTASDYGMEMARTLGRELTCCGVGVVSGWDDGISLAAHEGSVRGGSSSIVVVGAGLGASNLARRSTLLRDITRTGCAVSELPYHCPGRRWGRPAAERTVAALAMVTIVVEARSTDADLAPARHAESFARVIAAVPGRVTSPLSSGPNALLMEGARLIRGSEDVLEILYELDASPAPASAQRPQDRLEPRLRAVLERVGAGIDTIVALTAADDDGELLMALSELELEGLLTRGDGGRYVPTQPSARD